MQKTKVSILVVCFFLLLSAFTSFSSTDIAGTWKHAEKPALLHIDLQTGLITVKSHDDNQNAAGLTVIKHLSKSTESEGVWYGEMYNGYLDKYVPVKISAPKADILVIHDEKGSEVLSLLRL